MSMPEEKIFGKEQELENLEDWQLFEDDWDEDEDLEEF